MCIYSYMICELVLHDSVKMQFHNSQQVGVPQHWLLTLLVFSLYHCGLPYHAAPNCQALQNENLSFATKQKSHELLLDVLLSNYVESSGHGLYSRLVVESGPYMISVGCFYCYILTVSRLLLPVPVWPSMLQETTHRSKQTSYFINQQQT